MLYDDLSVQEHLEYTVRMHGGDGDEDVIDQLIDDLGPARPRGRPAVAVQPRACARRPRRRSRCAGPFSLLLVDEPFVGLDASGREAFLELLDDAHARGATLHGRDPRSRWCSAASSVAWCSTTAQIIHDGPASDLEDFLSADAAHHER